MPISFGTEGWRAVIGDKFTFDNVKKFAKAIANWLYWPKRNKLSVYSGNRSGAVTFSCESPKKGIAVGYDTRFMSDKFAAAIADEFAACGIPVFLSSSFTASPIISNFVRQNKLAAGIIITASHNSPEYNGVKYKGEYGGSAVSEFVWGIENILKSKKNYLPPFCKKAEVSIFSPEKQYIDDITEFVDMERIANSRFAIISDPIYGAAAGLLDKIFSSAGVYIDEIRNEKNPLFGGYTPIPAVSNIAPLMKKILKNNADVGFAFDGDGDTVGVVDSYGSFLQSYDVFSIILWHLIENRKENGGIAATFSTSKLIKSMAEKYGLDFYETPVGFRHITELMLKSNILAGGEESGGIGVKNSIPDKNGPLIALLLLEAMAMTGKSIAEIKSCITDKFGLFCLHRVDIKFKNNEEKDDVIAKLCQTLPASFANEKIKEISCLDGVKCLLQDGSWILFRASGTEPVFRIYAESATHQKSYDILNECEIFIQKIIG